MGIKEIARIAQVSPATVSNVLNGRKNVSEETRQRILTLCSETGYDVTRKHKNATSKSHTILFSFSDFDRSAHWIRWPETPAPSAQFP